MHCCVATTEGFYFGLIRRDKSYLLEMDCQTLSQVAAIGSERRISFGKGERAVLAGCVRALQAGSWNEPIYVNRPVFLTDYTGTAAAFQYSGVPRVQHAALSWEFACLPCPIKGLPQQQNVNNRFNVRFLYSI